MTRIAILSGKDAQQGLEAPLNPRAKSPGAVKMLIITVMIAMAIYAGSPAFRCAEVGAPPGPLCPISRQWRVPLRLGSGPGSGDDSLTKPGCIQTSEPGLMITVESQTFHKGVEPTRGFP